MAEKLIRKILIYGLGVVVFGLSFGAYIYTLAPTITAGDTTEMINAALVLGIPHQQSYPFITLLGYLFAHLPWGVTLAWRVNLMSAFFEALTNLLIYFLMLEFFRIINRRLRKTDSFWAFSASLFLGFSLTYWQMATKAEVFALNNFLSALIMLLVLLFLKNKKMIWFYAAVLGGALAFSHHQTAILIGPACLYLVWQERGRILADKKVWLRSLGLILAGLAPYFLSLIWLAKGNPPLNWGNPTNFAGAWRALARTDFGSFTYLKEAAEGAPATAVDQTVSYLKSLLDDFTVWGVLLAVWGGYSLWRRGLKDKQAKKVFWFSAIGLITGIAFLGYSRLPLKGSFSLATTKRFYLLPNMFLVIFLAFGLRFLWQKLKRLLKTDKQSANRFAKAMVFLALSLAFCLPVLLNFSKADNRRNIGTLKYGLDFYLATEPNAIIMLAGDVSNFTGQYIKWVELGGDNRIVFSPGQFHLKWFIPQLKQRYPDLVIPEPLAGNRFPVTSQVIWANYDRRPIYISPELASYDPEIEKNFVLWPKNLLFQIRKKGGEEKLEPYQEETEKLWQSLNLDWFGWVRKNNPLLEEAIISYYAHHFHNLGFMYDSVGLYEDAVREYQRALEIDSLLADSLKNLGLIYATKLKPPDYQKGIEYLSRFVAAIEKDSPQLAEQGRYTIAKIMADQEKELKEWAEKEATESAENQEESLPKKPEE